MRKKLVDRSKCTGCRNCELACVATHAPDGNILLAYAEGVEKSPRPRNKVEIDPEGGLFPQFCRHCDIPACAEACPMGAIAKDAEGYVICDAEKCVGCFMCVMSCPYGMARPSMVRGGKMFKCDGCVGHPEMACVAACPSGCLTGVDDSDAALEYAAGGRP